MDARDLAGGAINARQIVVTDYGVDPRGASIFGRLAGMLQRGIAGQVGTVYPGDTGDPSRSFNGDLGQPLQGFTGEAALALYGAARPISKTQALEDGSAAQSALTDPVLRVFAARARREQLTGTGL